jgi:endonuclease/exonuclease/phosphatase family metal-dependent hydrolase
MTDFTLASWNIRAGLGHDLRRRPLRTIEVITGMTADIFVLQEADFRMHPRRAALPTLHGRIGPYEVIDLTPKAVGLGWHGIAMLKRPEVIVDAIRRIDLPALEPRGAVILDIHIKDQALRVVGIHLGLLRGNRRKQIKYIADRVAELDHRPTIIAGDFNEWRERKGFETLPDSLRAHSPGRSFPANRPILKLDRFAMSQDVTLMTSAVSSDPLAKVTSDHRPIYAKFRV